MRKASCVPPILATNHSWGRLREGKGSYSVDVVQAKPGKEEGKYVKGPLIEHLLEVSLVLRRVYRGEVVEFAHQLAEDDVHQGQGDTSSNAGNDTKSD